MNASIFAWLAAQQLAWLSMRPCNVGSSIGDRKTGLTYDPCIESDLNQGPRKYLAAGRRNGVLHYPSTSGL